MGLLSLLLPLLCLFIPGVWFFQLNSYTNTISALEVYNAQPIDIHKHNNVGIYTNITISNKKDSEANSTETTEILKSTLPKNSNSIDKNKSNGKKKNRVLYIRYNTNNSGFANNILGLVSAYVISELLGATLVCKFYHLKSSVLS